MVNRFARRLLECSSSHYLRYRAYPRENKVDEWLLKSTSPRDSERERWSSLHWTSRRRWDQKSSLSVLGVVECPRQPDWPEMEIMTLQYAHHSSQLVNIFLRLSTRQKHTTISRCGRWSEEANSIFLIPGSRFLPSCQNLPHTWKKTYRRFNPQKTK